MINYQALSGILTLLALVPKHKASMHQATALMTLSSALLMVYLTKVPLAAVVV
jgi:heme A synthase